MKIYSENSIQAALNSLGLPCTVKNHITSYTTTTYTVNLDGGALPTTIKKAVGGLEVATGQKIVYNAFSGVSNTLKLTIPNSERDYPLFLDTFSASSHIPGDMLIGVDSENNVIYENITDTLSVLVAGATGSGKSVSVNNLIMSLILSGTADEINLSMIDLKRSELSVYDGNIPHLCQPVAYTFADAIRLIRITADEIDNRYKVLQGKGKRKADLSDFPIYILIIDEYAQLKQGTKEARDMLDVLMNKVVNLGRACNVFAIIATQNPVNAVINSTIKYGCQTKICLSVNNIRHSINIIDCKDAVGLLGKGDALVSLPNSPELRRIQVCNLPTSDILNIIT